MARTTVAVMCPACGPLTVFDEPHGWDWATLKGHELAWQHGSETGHWGLFEFHELSDAVEGVGG